MKVTMKQSKVQREMLLQLLATDEGRTKLVKAMEEPLLKRLTSTITARKLGRRTLTADAVIPQKWIKRGNTKSIAVAIQLAVTDVMRQLDGKKRVNFTPCEFTGEYLNDAKTGNTIFRFTLKPTKKKK